MALVLIAPGKKNLPEWKQGLVKEFKRLGVQVPVYLNEELTKPEMVRMAVVWKHPHERLHEFPNLEVVASMGAGVDHILADAQLPAHLRICRIVDPALTVSMSNYLIAVVLEQHKKLSAYRTHQQKKVWAYTDEPEKELRIGIMGMGVLGSDVALKLKMLGFSVSGFSTSRKQLEGIHTFAGMEELPAFLQACNVLICLLPLTPQTYGFLDKGLFSQCRPGTYVINVARGQHLVEADLLKALDEGQVSGACLDVFRTEPLPQDHPFWTNPKITITPHIASITKPEAAIPQLAENYLRMQQDLPLRHQVERDKGY